MYISIRDTHLEEVGYWNLAEGLQDLGIQAFELEIDRDMKAFDPESWEIPIKLADAAIAAVCAEEMVPLDIRCGAVLLHNDFSRDELETEIDWVVRCAEVAHALGADVVRIDALMRAHDGALGDDECIGLFIESMKKVIAATESVGIPFGIENHGVLANLPDFLETIVEGVGSERLGITMDTANFYWSGLPIGEVHKILKRLAPLARHTHIKNINYPADQRKVERKSGWEYAEYMCPIPDGDIDIPKVIKWLGDSGFDGGLCIENECTGRYTDGERAAVLKREVDYLKSLI